MGGKNKQRTKGNVRVGTTFSKRNFILKTIVSIKTTLYLRKRRANIT